jgi:hypothetical protein
MLRTLALCAGFLAGIAAAVAGTLAAFLAGFPEFGIPGMLPGMAAATWFGRAMERRAMRW